MLTVGDLLPSFSLTGVRSEDTDSAFVTVSDTDYRGRWLVLFTWPKDFTFVCPTEIGAFGEAYPQFKDLDADVLGVSTDNEYVHLAWRQANPLLTGLPFPMAADLRRDLTTALGVLDRNEGVALRATFIIDPEGVIRHVSVNDLDTGRNVNEVVRTLAACQAGGLTACNWVPGQSLLEG
jgi:peroxiredoxin (alkyl hydroperoxide reductase subunit C)